MNNISGDLQSNQLLPSCVGITFINESLVSCKNTAVNNVSNLMIKPSINSLNSYEINYYYCKIHRTKWKHFIGWPDLKLLSNYFFQTFKLVEAQYEKWILDCPVLFVCLKSSVNWHIFRNLVYPASINLLLKLFASGLFVTPPYLRHSGYECIWFALSPYFILYFAWW